MMAPYDSESLASYASYSFTQHYPSPKHSGFNVPTTSFPAEDTFLGQSPLSTDAASGPAHSSPSGTLLQLPFEPVEDLWQALESSLQIGTPHGPWYDSLDIR